MAVNRSDNSVRLAKDNISNRENNNNLKLAGMVKVAVNDDKYEADKASGGLKRYVTNSSLKSVQIIDNYKHLWQVKKVFRISKTDLQIRLIYHQLRHRIERHSCIAFTACSIYEELEKVLAKEKPGLNVKFAADLTHNKYQLNMVFPDPSIKNLYY